MFTHVKGLFFIYKKWGLRGYKLHGRVNMMYSATSCENVSSVICDHVTVQKHTPRFTPDTCTQC